MWKVVKDERKTIESMVDTKKKELSMTVRELGIQSLENPSLSWNMLDPDEALSNTKPSV